MSDKTRIALNNFVRRTDHTSKLKELISGTGAMLSRKGRSRNWVLTISSQQAIALRKAIEEAGQTTWLWLANLLTKEQKPLSEAEIKTIAMQHWPITVSELMSISDCTLAEARKVIDEVEWG